MFKEKTFINFDQISVIATFSFFLVFELKLNIMIWLCGYVLFDKIQLLSILWENNHCRFKFINSLIVCIYRKRPTDCPWHLFKTKSFLVGACSDWALSWTWDVIKKRKITWRVRHKKNQYPVLNLELNVTGCFCGYGRLKEVLYAVYGQLVGHWKYEALSIVFRSFLPMKVETRLVF